MEGSGKEAVFAIWQLPEATWDQAISAELKARGSGFAVLTRALATEAGGARALDEKPRGRSQPVPRRNDLGEIGEVTIGADGQEYVSMVVRNNWKLARDCLVEWKELDPVTRDRMIGDPSVAIPKRIVDRVRLTNAIRGVA